jgi:hypothetical protein
MRPAVPDDHAGVAPDLADGSGVGEVTAVRATLSGPDALVVRLAPFAAVCPMRAHADAGRPDRPAPPAAADRDHHRAAQRLVRMVLSDRARGPIGAAEFAAMTPDAILVHTSRAG